MNKSTSFVSTLSVNNLINLNRLRSMVYDAFDWDFEDGKGGIQNLIKYSGLNVEVKETWIDCGANWKDEQIVVTYINQRDGKNSFQLLSPRDVIAMKNGGIDISLANHYIKIVIRHLKEFGNSLNDHLTWYNHTIPIENRVIVDYKGGE